MTDHSEAISVQKSGCGKCELVKQPAEIKVLLEVCAMLFHQDPSSLVMSWGKVGRGGMSSK
jgi:hypothetical protein